VAALAEAARDGDAAEAALGKRRSEHIHNGRFIRFARCGAARVLGLNALTVRQVRLTLSLPGE
jgi:hypothetical protein